MAHVHGAEGMATAAKAAGMMKGMAESAKSAGGMGKMMGEMGMGPMMGGMGPGPGHMMANIPQAAKGAAGAGAAMAASSQAGGGFLSKLARHPGVVFGLGVAAGVLIYKYRKAIIGITAQATGKTGEKE